MKDAVWARIDGLAEELYSIGDWIHRHPELGFHEVEASRLLSQRLEQAGFAVERGLHGLETAFRASYVGSAPGPTVAFIAEYDALPQLGHACGHNLIGTAAVGAAIALKEAAGPLPGRIVVMGTPAEEVPPPVKRQLVEAGYFEGIDVALMIHGADRTAVGGETMAVQSMEFHYHGKPSHAASMPDLGVSALDAAVLTMHAIELLREHVRSDTRIHGIVTNGGQAANIVPEYASLLYYIRSFDSSYLDEVVSRVENCARGAGLAVGARVEIQPTGRWDSRYNVPALNDLLLQHAVEAGAFQLLPVSARAGSTDFGTVTQLLPAATLKVALVDEGVSGHTSAFERAAGGERGRRCLLFGTKAIAATAYDVITQPTLLERIKREFAEGR